MLYADGFDQLLLEYRVTIHRDKLGGLQHAFGFYADGFDLQRLETNGKNPPELNSAAFSMPSALCRWF